METKCFYNQINHWESNGFDYKVDTKAIASDYVIKSITKRPQLIFGANFYQELDNDGDYISMALNSNMRPDKGDNNTITNYTEDMIRSNVQTMNRQDRIEQRSMRCLISIKIFQN
jgi:hypothetical protein